jgi:hypothetical protein
MTPRLLVYLGFLAFAGNATAQPAPPESPDPKKGDEAPQFTDQVIVSGFTGSTNGPGGESTSWNAHYFCVCLHHALSCSRFMDAPNRGRPNSAVGYRRPAAARQRPSVAQGTVGWAISAVTRVCDALWARARNP